MNLVIITPHVPYPLDEGGKISQFSFAERLQHLLKLTYIIRAYNDEVYAYGVAFKTSLPDAKIHIIDCRGLVKGNVMKKLLTSVKRRVVNFFYKCFLSNKTDACFDDYDRDIDFLREISRYEVNEILKLVDEIKPDLIQVEHTGYLNLVHALPVSIVKIFVHHEIQFARLESFKDPKTYYEIYKRSLIKGVELSFLEKYDAVLTFSEIDTERLNNCLVDRRVCTSPFPILDTYFEEVSIQDFKISKIIFVGPESHRPNYDAVVWYVDNIAEKIYLNTGLKSHIVGKWSEGSMKRLSREFIVFDGFVEDIMANNRKSLVVVPIRGGSGIRTKILYSLAQCLPIVSTSIGCEGIGLIPDRDIVIKDDVQGFLESILFLVHNINDAHRIANNGYLFAKAHFSQDKLVNKRLNIYESLIK